MADSVPFEIASTLQTASINRHPDPRHDMNPSTAASRREPVIISSEDMSDVGEDEIPLSVLRPLPRRQTLPPLPDLRFEQSYLRSIEKADSWVKVVWITFRDQVCGCRLCWHCGLCANLFFVQLVVPLVTGTIWELGLSGWRHWNRSTQSSGSTWGFRMRRWLVDNGFVRRQN
jgi:hypothetical protein